MIYANLNTPSGTLFLCVSYSNQILPFVLHFSPAYYCSRAALFLMASTPIPRPTPTQTPIPAPNCRDVSRDTPVRPAKNVLMVPIERAQPLRRSIVPSATAGTPRTTPPRNVRPGPYAMTTRSWPNRARHFGIESVFLAHQEGRASARTQQNVSSHSTWFRPGSVLHAGSEAPTHALFVGAIPKTGTRMPPRARRPIAPSRPAVPMPAAFVARTER